MRVAFCVSGRGSLFRAAVRDADALGISPVLLVADTTAAGDLAAFAAGTKVPFVALTGTSHAAINASLEEALSSADPDLVVLTFDRIIGASLVQKYARRIINVHPALLPALPGKRAIERTLASGARFGGATIHEVDTEVDAGAIVAQAVVPTDPDESIDAYGARLYAVLEPMFLQVLKWYAADRIEHHPMGGVLIRGGKYASYPVSPALE